MKKKFKALSLVLLSLLIFGLVGCGSDNNTTNNANNTTNNTKGYSKTYGLRPVFKLKTNVKVTGGKGTSSSPYTLGT